MIVVLYILGGLLAALVIAIGAFIVLAWVTSPYPKGSIARQMADGTFADHFVYIGEDGTARELTEDERNYLNTPFEGPDGARPYIKWRYGQLTPDKKLLGYLERRRVPKHVPIKSAPEGPPQLPPEYWDRFARQPVPTTPSET
jgi:hypothetical protein